ncbi:MAG: hypothetical protein QM764_14635 [Chitinophagaceae bacterium]
MRDLTFAISIAKSQDSAYYISQNQPVPSFDAEKDSTKKKSFKEEKIAINVAGFYATECGIGALMEQKGETPVFWLKKIAEKRLDSSEILLLNRFANATWKAGQPFRSLSRIAKDNFIVANFLSKEEIQKDYDQVSAAASKLLDSLKTSENALKEEQLQKIKSLLQDKQFAFEMAKHIEASYYSSLKKEVPPFLNPGEDTLQIDKSIFEEKIAINIAGFYALECGLSYFAAAQDKAPSDVLNAILADTISTSDKQLFERFANATWKAGQPFRSLDRITRDIFIPFDLLSKEEIEKDWVQIKNAAKKVKEIL